MKGEIRLFHRFSTFPLSRNIRLGIRKILITARQVSTNVNVQAIQHSSQKGLLIPRTNLNCNLNFSNDSIFFLKAALEILLWIAVDWHRHQIALWPSTDQIPNPCDFPLLSQMFVNMASSSREIRRSKHFKWI